MRASWPIAVSVHFPRSMIPGSIRVMMQRKCLDTVCPPSLVLCSSTHKSCSLPPTPLLFFLSFPSSHIEAFLFYTRRFNNIFQAMLFMSFGVLTSLVSSVAAFNAAGGSLRAWRALHEDHDKRLFKFSSVDSYRGEDFFNDTCL